MPAPHHSAFYTLDALLPPNQQCQSTEGSTHVELTTDRVESVPINSAGHAQAYNSSIYFIIQSIRKQQQLS